MPADHPALPKLRPLAVAHRAGNDLAAAQHALDLGAAMLEVDIWPRLFRLETRHVKTIGPLPIFWEKWEIVSVGGKPMRLDELLEWTPDGVRLLLDLKGMNPLLGRRVVRAAREARPGLELVICGRNWRQLDRIETLPGVHVFYSAGEAQELDKAWSKLERQEHPAISIRESLLTDETLDRLRQLNAAIVAWTVNDPKRAHELVDLGVDAITTDNLELLADLAKIASPAFSRPAGPHSSQKT